MFKLFKFIVVGVFVLCGVGVFGQSVSTGQGVLPFQISNLSEMNDLAVFGRDAENHQFAWKFTHKVPAYSRVIASTDGDDADLEVCAIATIPNPPCPTDEWKKAHEGSAYLTCPAVATTPRTVLRCLTIDDVKRLGIVRPQAGK